MLLDISAPIVPFNGFGEIRLYSTRDELQELLKKKMLNQRLYIIIGFGMIFKIV